MSIEVTQADRDAAHEWMRGQSTGLRMMMVKPRGLYEAFARHRLQAKASKDTEIQQAVAAEVAQIVAAMRGLHTDTWLAPDRFPAWRDHISPDLTAAISDWIERGEYKETSGE